MLYMQCAVCVGSLTSQAQSELQPWHRDTYHLFDDDAHEVCPP